MEHPLYLVYSLSMLATAVIIALLASRLLRRYEKRSTESLKQAAGFDPVRANSVPVPDHNASFRGRALDNIGTQFTIIRRTVVGVVLVVWVILASLPYLGSISTGLASLLGAGGAVIMGIAARPLLENIIAGYVVTFSKQFRAGDTVMLDGEYGTINDITPTHTVIRLWDWRRYVMPNSSMLTKEIINYRNRDSLIWACLKFQIAYDSDLKRVREIAVDGAAQSKYLAGDEDPQFWIMRMDRESIECWLAMWTRGPADAWAIRVETAEQLITAFQKEGIHTHGYQINPGMPPALRD